MDLQLKDKTALVTGASVGIGRGIAKALAAEGVHVAISARRTDKLKELSDEIEQAGGKRPVIIESDLYVEDAAAAIVRAAESHEGTEPINLGSDSEITIRETAETIASVVGYTGTLQWDATKPDGQPRRRIDATRAEQLLGWKATMKFRDGLAATVDWYLANRAAAEAAPR
mgnify:CR=1 FL=1